MSDVIDDMIKNILLNLNNTEYDLSSEQIDWIKKFIALSPKSLENILISSVRFTVIELELDLELLKELDLELLNDLTLL